jgi:hypothetical protein
MNIKNLAIIFLIIFTSGEIHADSFFTKWKEKRQSRREKKNVSKLEKNYMAGEDFTEEEASKLTSKYCACKLGDDPINNPNIENAALCLGEIKRVVREAKDNGKYVKEKHMFGDKDTDLICTKSISKSWHKKNRNVDLDEDGTPKDNSSEPNRSEPSLLDQITETYAKISIKSSDKKIEISDSGNSGTNEARALIGDADYEKCKSAYSELVAKSKKNPNDPDVLNVDQFLKSKGCPVDKLASSKLKDSTLSNFENEMGKVLSIKSADKKIEITDAGNISSVSESCKKAFKDAVKRKVEEDKLVDFMKENKCPEIEDILASNTNQKIGTGDKSVATLTDECLTKATLEEKKSCISKKQMETAMAELDRDIASENGGDLNFSAKNSEGLVELSDEFTDQKVDLNDLEGINVASQMANRREFKKDLKNFKEDMFNKHCSELLYKGNRERDKCFESRMDLLGSELGSNNADEYLKSLDKKLEEKYDYLTELNKCSDDKVYSNKNKKEMCSEYIRYEYLNTLTIGEMNTFYYCSPIQNSNLKLIKNYGDNFSEQFKNDNSFEKCKENVVAYFKNVESITNCKELAISEDLLPSNIKSQYSGEINADKRMTLSKKLESSIDFKTRDGWFKSIQSSPSTAELENFDLRSLFVQDCQCRKFESSRNVKECETWVKRYGNDLGDSCVAEKKIPEEFIKEILSAKKLKYNSDGTTNEGAIIDDIGENYFSEMQKQDADYKKAVRATNDIADEAARNDAISKIVLPKDYRVMFNSENKCQCQMFKSDKSKKACIDYIAENGDANLKYNSECSDSPNKTQCWALAAGRETLRALGTVLSQRDDALGAIAAVGMNFGACVPRDFMSQVKCNKKSVAEIRADQSCSAIVSKKCQGVNDANLVACATSNTITGMNINSFGREIKECPGIPDGANKIKCKQRINDECLKLADQEKLVCANNIIASIKAFERGEIYNETKGFADGMGAQISGEDNVAAYNANGIDSANGYKDARKMEAGLCLAGALTNSVKDLCIRTTKEGSPQRKNCDFAANVLDAGMHVADCLRESPVPTKKNDGSEGPSPRQLCFIKNGAQSASKLLLGDGESTKCFSIKDEKERNKCLARAAVTAGGEFTDCFNLQNPDLEIQKQMRQRCMLRKGGQAVLAQIPTDTPQGKAIHTAVNIGTALGSCGAFNKGAFKDTTKSQNMDMAMCMTQSMLPFITDVFASDEKCNKIEDDEARGKCLAKNESIRQIAQVANTAIQVAQYAKQCENAQDKRACYLQGLASFIPGEAGVYLKYMASGYTAMKMKCDSLPLEVQKAGALVGTGGDLFTHIYQKVKVKKLKGIYQNRNVKGGEHSGETLGVKFASNDPLDALRFAEDSKWLEHDLLKKQILFQNIQLTLTAAGTTLAAFEAAIPTKHMKPTICKDAEPKTPANGFYEFNEFLNEFENESLFAHLNKANEIEIFAPNMQAAFHAMANANNDIDALIISKEYELTMSNQRSYSLTLDEYKQLHHDYLAATVAEYGLPSPRVIAKETINVMEVILPTAFAQEAAPADGKKKNPNFWQTTDLVASMAGEGLMGNITGVAAMTPLGHCHSIVHKIIDKAYEKGVKKEFAGKATLKVASKAAASLLLRQIGTETKAKIQSSKLGAVVVGVSTGLNLKKQLDENKKRLVNSEAAAKETSNKRVEYEEIHKKAIASGGEVVIGESGSFEVSTKAKEDKEAEAQREPATSDNIGHRPGDPQ